MSADSKIFISAKDIVKKYGIPYSTVTHYTNLGFFSVVKRKGSKRLYNEEEVGRKLSMITRLRDEGYPLRLIRKQLIG